MPDFYHEIDSRIFVPETKDIESVFFKAELGEYDSFKLAHEAVRTLWLAYKGEIIKGPIHRILLRDETDSTVKDLKYRGVARIRRIATGEVYNFEVELFGSVDNYTAMHAAVLETFAAALSIDPAEYFYDVVEVSTMLNPYKVEPPS